MYVILVVIEFVCIASVNIKDLMELATNVVNVGLVRWKEGFVNGVL